MMNRAERSQDQASISPTDRAAATFAGAVLGPDCRACAWMRELVQFSRRIDALSEIASGPQTGVHSLGSEEWVAQ